MKKIEAIIRPERIGPVRKAIEEVGYQGLTITDVRGHGTQRGITQQFRGTTFTVDILPKIKLELVVPDASVPKLLKAITEAARTNQVGDGKIFVTTVDDAMRVRTGETGEKAL